MFKVLEKSCVDQVLEQVFIKEQEERQARERSGKFNPSSFGRCYRNQVFNRLDVPQDNPMSFQGWKNVTNGTVIHDYIEQYFEDCEILIEDDDFKSFADIRLKTEQKVVDIKSISSYGWRNVIKQGYNPIEKSLHHVLQVLFYAKKLELPKASIVYVTKENFVTLEFEFDVAKCEHLIDREITTLKEIWESKKLPPAQPRAYLNANNEPQDCRYCAWSNLCQKIEKGETDEYTKF